MRSQAATGQPSKSYDDRSPRGIQHLYAGLSVGGEIQRRCPRSQGPEGGTRVIDRASVQRLEHDDAGDTVEAAIYATSDGEIH